MRPQAELDNLESKYAERIRAPYSLACIDEVPDPHPFMVGTAHVAAASDRHGGILGEAALCAHGCYVKGCGRPYTAHRWDTILFIRMPEPMGGFLPEDLADTLRALGDEATADGISGFAFLDPGNIHHEWREKR